MNEVCFSSRKTRTTQIHSKQCQNVPFIPQVEQPDCRRERRSERSHTAEAFWQDTGKKIISGFYGVAALVAERDGLYLFTCVITADLDHVKELLSISDLEKKTKRWLPTLATLFENLAVTLLVCGDPMQTLRFFWSSLLIIQK